MSRVAHDSEVTHPPFIEMIEDALSHIGEEASEGQIREYIKGHFELRETPKEFNTCFHDGLRKATELEEIEKTGGTGRKSCRFRLCGSAAQKDPELLKTRAERMFKAAGFEETPVGTDKYHPVHDPLVVSSKEVKKRMKKY